MCADQELAEKHKTIASNCEHLRHKIELLLNSEISSENIDLKMDSILEEWSNIDAASVSEKLFLKSKQKIKDFHKYPDELSFLETSKEVSIKKPLEDERAG